MARTRIQFLLISLIALFLAACSDIKDVAVNFSVKSEGQPVSNAEVLIDGDAKGVTDANGQFKTMIKQKVGTSFVLAVRKDENGLRLEDWQQDTPFTENSEHEFNINLDLKTTAYITIKATSDGKPLPKASLVVNRKTVASADEEGMISYDLPSTGKNKLKLKVVKNGYESWVSKGAISAGDQLEAKLIRQMILRVKASTEKYGETQALAGVDVYLGGKKVGKTNAKGVFALVRRGKKGAKSELTLKSPGYLPESYSKKIKLIGSNDITQHYYAIKPEPVRVGFYQFTANTDGEDIGTIPMRFQNAIKNRLAKSKGFTIVDGDKLATAIKAAKLSLTDIKTKGWRDTSLYRIVDTIVFGSVSKDIKGQFVVEANFHSAEGGIATSEIGIARNVDKIDRTAKSLVINAKEHFPFSGLIYKQDNDEFLVNLGDDKFPVNKKDEFVVFNPKMNKKGRITGYSKAGIVRLTKTRDDYSIAKIKNADKKKFEIKSAAKVVRRTGSDLDSKDFVTVAVKSLLEGEIQPLDGVNVYLDKKWIATTNKDGKARVPVRLDKEYDLALYRHGFSQIERELEVEKNAELREFTLDPYVSKLVLETTPSNATVYLDDVVIGRTPLAGKTVPTGFHTLRISAGGDYRDFEEVLEFTNETLDLSGEGAVALHIDYLKKGEFAENNSNFDDAIVFYDKTTKMHPDYADARSRLAQIYLDEKRDADAAIAEYEKLMAIPEVRELVYKQFAVTYTNMGHAYHAKANNLIHSDKKAAAKHLAKSLKYLKTALSNARFFPNEHYDEAIHDTYFYLALTYHKLYQLSSKKAIMDKAQLAWRDYLDFFPDSLETIAAYQESKASAYNFLEQLK